MKWAQYIDSGEVRKAISILQKPDSVFEVRVIGTAKKDILSGYFKDADTLLKAFDTIDLRQRNVYITLGELREECFSRAQSEKFLKSPQTSSDTEVVRYRWLFVDLDPVRTAGVSSNDAELMEAVETAGKVLSYLRDLGLEDPVQALSGNGFHLLYRIDVVNDAAGRDLVERCLKALAEKFDTDKVKIDTTNSNPSRICKLHGTLAQKGRSTNNRPHRMSQIVNVPEELKISGIDALQNLAGKAPVPIPATPRRATAPESFDLLQFMSRHGMTYTESSNNRAKIYSLDECPFDPSHKDGDAKIFLYSDGAIAFKCHHNSCSQYKWQDVRRKFEPDAYDKDPFEDDARIDEGYFKHKNLIEAKHQKPKKQVKIRTLRPAAQLLAEFHPDPKVFVGVESQLPLLTEGTCILSAKPKLGKSWFALCMCLAISRGEDFLGYKTRKCSTLYLDLETSASLQQKRIRKVLKGDKVPDNFYIESETNRLGDGFVEQIESYLKEDPDIGVVVVDVFPIIRTESKNQRETEYEHAYRDISPLNDLAKKYHISIILVTHDRKAVDPEDAFSNILGSTGLQGAAGQMIVMYRRSKNEPIHISVKGKSIDGVPELDVKFEDAEWTTTDAADTAEAERQRMLEQYRSSEIREAVLRVLDGCLEWKGRAGELIVASADDNFGLTYPPKEIGGFLSRNIGLFLAEDNIHVKRISNGSGGKLYKIWKTTVDTVDGTVDENEENE